MNLEPQLWMLNAWGEKLAREALAANNGKEFGMAGYSNHTEILVVEENAELLMQRGMYAAALMEALTGAKHNNRGYSAARLERLIKAAGRDAFRACGTPVPSDKVLTVYRGVAGESLLDKRVRGLSWTTRLEIACWFATRSARVCECDPEIYSANIRPRTIYACWGDRDEAEIICRPRRPFALGMSIAEIDELSDRFGAEKFARDREQLERAAKQMQIDQQKKPGEISDRT